MSEQAPQTPPRQAPREGKSAKSKSKVTGFAPIEGENAEDPRPAEETPGTPEHLGSDRPYEGGDSPFVEGDPDARNR